jgi:hypothetical protein
MNWVAVAWIRPLFAAVNGLAPNRAHGQDGTIGDAAHQAETSGHNPDDTPGVSAERQDADTIPEVRAADVDADLRQPGLSMEDIVQAVLHGPAAELNRLIYIIYNRRIWRKSNGWRQETYTGSDPHDRHAHFSGDPASDDDARPWTSIENLGDDMIDMGQQIPDLPPGVTVGLFFRDAWPWLATLRGLSPQDADGTPLPRADDRFKSPVPQAALLDAIRAQSVPPAAPLDQDALDAAVGRALARPEVLAAIATAVADENYRRQAA